MTERGLTNGRGENNCFLNSVTQALYHVKAFRREFDRDPDHTCANQDPSTPANCVFCALKILFTQMDHSAESAVSPEVLRSALASLYEPSHRFQLNEMSDAAECFDAVLRCLHRELGRVSDDDRPCAPTCTAHTVFGFTMVDQITCAACKATSEPVIFQQYAQYLSATLLREGHKKNESMRTVWQRSLADSGFSCPSSCASAASKLGTSRRSLISAPKVFTLGLIWESNQSSVTDIVGTLEAIEPCLDVKSIFSDEPPSSSSYSSSDMYSVEVVVCYYGLHYVAFFYSHAKRRWVLVDDAMVVPCNRTWLGLLKELAKAHYQPLLLMYSVGKHDGADANAPIAYSSSSRRRYAAPQDTYGSSSSSSSGWGMSRLGSIVSSARSSSQPLTSTVYPVVSGSDRQHITDTYTSSASTHHDDDRSNSRSSQRPLFPTMDTPLYCSEDEDEDEDEQDERQSVTVTATSSIRPVPYRSVLSMSERPPPSSASSSTSLIHSRNTMKLSQLLSHNRQSMPSLPSPASSSSPSDSLRRGGCPHSSHAACAVCWANTLNKSSRSPLRSAYHL